MNALVPIALIGWPFLVLLLFSKSVPRRAAFIAIIGGWLFLPMAELAMPEGPAYSKRFVTSMSVLIGMLVFDSRALAEFRLKWIDVPILLFCVTPICTSLSNDLGLYDGLVAAYGNIFSWGIPYLIGRIYLNNYANLQEFLVAIIIGVVVYVPFCVIEMVLSPQLHMWVYGFHQHSFLQTMRSGGYRPMVFMQHGLMVSLWMAMGTLSAVCLRLYGDVKKGWRTPLSWAAFVSLVVTLSCRSKGALILLCVGGLVLLITWQTRRYWALTALILFPVLYTSARVTSMMPKEVPLTIVSKFSTPDKVGSLGARLTQEDLFSAHGLRRPWFGWGAWDRNFPTDPVTGKRLTRGVDGLWTIIISQYGLVGLGSLLTALSLPSLTLIWRTSAESLKSTKSASLVAAILVVAIFTVECLPNGMVNPVYLVLLGGIGTLSSGGSAFKAAEELVRKTRVIAPRRALHPGHSSASQS